jgi:hypothetical protein
MTVQEAITRLEDKTSPLTEKEQYALITLAFLRLRELEEKIRAHEEFHQLDEEYREQSRNN